MQRTAEPDREGQASTGGGAVAASSVHSTHFNFQHKVFSIRGGVFRMAPDGGEPLYHVEIGDLRCGISLPSLMNEFGITPDSHDGRLLSLVGDSLRFVKEIRPNDSIPNELLDGSCSWTVEERHRTIARNRLSVQLAAWLSGGEMAHLDAEQLEMLAEDPQTKKRVQKAFDEAAEKLGLGRERRDEVVDRFETLARELAYIEALRERFGAVRMILTRLGQTASLYKRERTVTEEIVRVLTLMRRPEAEFQTAFGLIDANTCEILMMLRKIDEQIAFIRQNRDDLHHRLMQWDDLIAKWQEIKLERGEELENLVRATYRFVAQHYIQRSEWKLTNNVRR